LQVLKGITKKGNPNTMPISHRNVDAFSLAVNKCNATRLDFFLIGAA
jgi:hypothetical protein